MRIVSTLATATAIFLASATVAQPAPEVVKTGAMVKSADGKRIGQIARVIKGQDGTPQAASVIVDERLVRIPVSTISMTDAGLVTTMSRAEVRKLN